MEWQTWKEARKCVWWSPAKPLWTRPITLKWHHKWTCGQQRSPWTISLKMQTTNPHSRHRSDRVTVIFFCIWHECSPWKCKAGFDILLLMGTAAAGLSSLSEHETNFSCGTLIYIAIFLSPSSSLSKWVLPVPVFLVPDLISCLWPGRGSRLGFPLWSYRTNWDNTLCISVSQGKHEKPPHPSPGCRLLVLILYVTRAATLDLESAKK